MQTIVSRIFILFKNKGAIKYIANTSWMFAEQGLRIVVGVCVGVWVARYLGPAAYGTLNYVLALLGIFVVTAKLGLDGLIVRDLVKFPLERDRYLGTGFWLKIVGACITVLTAYVVTLCASDAAEERSYILLLSFGLLFQAFEVVDFYFQSRVLARYVTLCRCTQLTASAALKVFLIIVNADLKWFIVVVFVDQVTLAMFLFIAYRSQKVGSFYLSFDKKIALNLMRNSWPYVINGLAIMIYMRIDQVMVKSMLGDRAAGVYSSAVKLTEIWYVIPVIICNSIFPAIVKAKQLDPQVYEDRLRKLYFFLVWTAIAVALPMTFLSDALVLLLYGEPYKEAGRVLSINVWAGVFVFLGVASSKWYLNENLQRYLTVNTALGAILNISLNFVLIPLYGISGAAIATILSQAAASYVMNLAFSATRGNFFLMTRAVFLK